MTRSRSLAVLVVAVACGCVSGSVNRRLSDLEAEEQRRHEKLRQLNSQITAAEQRIDQARAEAGYQECLAKKAEVESAIAVEKAECLREIAQRSACISNNEARTTKGTGLGCAAGWAAALVTGGAAAPAIAIGCASGAALSKTSKKSCGEVPACGMSDDLAPAVLARLGVSAVPRCVAPMIEPVSTGATFGMDLHAGQDRRSTSCETWRVEWVQFDVPPRKRSGQAWDADGSEPDLMYTIAVDGKQVYRSAKYQTLTWNHSPRGVNVSLGETIAIVLVDRDLVSHDRIAEFQLKLTESPSDAPMTLMGGRTKLQVKFACAEGG